MQKMIKYINIVLLLLIVNKVKSQIGETKLDLLKAKNQTIKVNLNYKLNVQIYPEMPRFGEYKLINKNNKTIYSDIYANVDFIVIDFKEFAKKMKSGKYKLIFTSLDETLDAVENKQEVEIINLKFKKIYK